MLPQLRFCWRLDKIFANRDELKMALKSFLGRELAFTLVLTGFKQKLSCVCD